MHQIKKVFSIHIEIRDKIHLFLRLDKTSTRRQTPKNTKTHPHLLYFCCSRPEEFDVPGPDDFTVLRERLRRVIFLGEEDKRVTRCSSIGFPYE